MWCVHFVIYKFWRSCSSELHFYWSITVPIHIDLWLPGLTGDSNGNNLYIPNCMCNLSQFIIYLIPTSTKSITLPHIFTPDAVSSFGIWSVVVINSGNIFTAYSYLCVRHWRYVTRAYLEVVIPGILFKDITAFSPRLIQLLATTVLLALSFYRIQTQVNISETVYQ